MPNWTSITAKISHDEPNEVVRIANAVKDNRLFHEFHPCPEDLENIDAACGDVSEELKEIYAKNVEKYGFAHWYDWRVANWGTKLDSAFGSVTHQEEKSVTVFFRTAWAPPLAGFKALEDQGFKIHTTYVGEFDEFSGVYSDGENKVRSPQRNRS